MVKDLVLIGGGHSHAIVLQRMGMQPLAGVRLTLITDTYHTPYSGMLPGYIAGLYTYDETHIDLRRLAGFARAQVYLDRVVGLDLTHNKVICQNHPPVAFDSVSINIGSTPATLSVPGASDFAIPAKPVPQLLAAWHQIVAALQQHPQEPLTLGIIGGGAGGVELCLNIQAKLHQLLTEAQSPTELLRLHLWHRGSQLLPHHSDWVGRHLEHLLRKRNVHLHLQETVVELAPALWEKRCQEGIPSSSSLQQIAKDHWPQAVKVICGSGLAVTCDRVFWVTQASAPSWIKASGLMTDDQVFIVVSDTLQSVSHPQVFAAGDIATVQGYPRPKAGVFAVRQGKPLFTNLRRIFSGQALVPYRPQAQYLSLIGTGDGRAIASWSGLGWHSSLLWRWKDQIDRTFMRRLDELPKMEEGDRPYRSGPQLSDTSSAAIDTMHCAGCGSKIGRTILNRVLQRLPAIPGQDILIGLDEPDDAAVIQVPAGQLLVQTIDYFRSLLNDPFTFGQIATHHCLSDLYAMGATPHSVLAVVTVPYGTESVMEETLFQVLSGAGRVLRESHIALIGGHTSEGPDLAFGLSGNGLVSADHLLRKSGMQPGQALVLTKAIGTGTLFAADMCHQAKGRWIEQAVASMLQSNQAAAHVFRQHGATACTDVTGFGLLGHLVEMVVASKVGIELDLKAIPLLPGARNTISAGYVSSLQGQNLRTAAYVQPNPSLENLTAYSLLFDPQTSGGLLTSIPDSQTKACLQQLQSLGYTQSALIGRVVPATTAKPIAILWA